LSKRVDWGVEEINLKRKTKTQMGSYEGPQSLGSKANVKTSTSHGAWVGVRQIVMGGGKSRGGTKFREAEGWVGGVETGEERGSKIKQCPSVMSITGLKTKNTQNHGPGVV